MSLKQKALSGFVWVGIQKLGTGIIGLAVELILTRLILPEEYGLLGLILIFNAIGITLTDSGLSQSILRMKDPKQSDYSTLFTLNFVIAFVTYAILFFCAPLISAFYEQPDLLYLVRIYTLMIPIEALKIVQVTKLTKEFKFKLQASIELPSLLLSGTIGLLLAYLGYGVWALVWMTISRSILLNLYYWWKINYRPSILFDKDKIKYHFNFGYKLLLSSVLNSIVVNIYPSIIGMNNSIEKVGFYTRAGTFRKVPLDLISSIFQKVSYPLLAEIQNEVERLKKVYRILIKVILLITTLVMCIAILVADSLIPLVFGDTWISMVIYFQWLCGIGIIYPLHVFYLNSLNVRGRSDLFLKAEIVKKIVTISILCYTAPLGIIYIIYGQLVSSVLNLFVNQYFCQLVIPYTFMEQNTDALRVVLPSTILLFFCLYFSQFISDESSGLLYILGMTTLFSVAYSLLHWTLNKDTLQQVISIIQNFKNRNALRN